MANTSIPASLDKIPLQRPGRLKEYAYEEIKRLLSTQLVDQATVFSANRFAEQFGISRTPVREALLQLEAEGFLTAAECLGFKIKEHERDPQRHFGVTLIPEKDTSYRLTADDTLVVLAEDQT